MALQNHTSLAALMFDVRDKHGSEFHAVVARGTFALVPAGLPKGRKEADPGPRPTYATALRATPQVAVKDRYFGEINKSSVREESDLAQYKPRCDVIVVGSAESPTGEEVPSLEVGIRIFGRPSEDRRPLLLQRDLVVSGERDFVKEEGGWKLTDPRPFASMPLRYEQAFGGELRVEEGDEAADRVPDEHRLSKEIREKHPDGAPGPIAHEICEENPLGRGYLLRWYEEAKKVDRWPAPRIEAKGSALSAEDFERLIRGDIASGSTNALRPQGFGVIAKPWSPRLPLAGTFDDAWLAERWPRMPMDFDMAYWNGAHPEMQCPHLFGGEIVEIRNMLPAGAPVEDGATVCRFELPKLGVRVAFVRAADVVVSLAPIDTVIVDLEEKTLSLVWRTGRDVPNEAIELYTREE